MIVPIPVVDAEDGAILAATVMVLLSTIQWTASSPWWRDPIGATVVVKDLALLLVLVPLCILLVWPDVIDPLAGAIITLASMAVITLVMAWRCIVWYRIQRPWPLPQRAERPSDKDLGLAGRLPLRGVSLPGRLGTLTVSSSAGRERVAVLSSSVFGTPFEGFSLSHAAILSGTTGAEAQTIYGVRNGSISTDQGNFENTGDDVVLSEHFWINFANVTIEEGYVPFSTIALITGTSVGSSGAAGNDYYAIDLWTLNSMNQPTQPMAIRVPAKDAAGQIRTLDFVLYKVQFQPFNFTGPSYKTGLSCSIAGRALFSTTNEVGNSFFDGQGMRLGRLVSWPGNLSGAFVTEPFSGVVGTALAAGQSVGTAF